MSLGEPVEIDRFGVARFGDLAFEQAPGIDLHLADDQNGIAVLGSRFHLKTLSLELTPEEVSQAPDYVTRLCVGTGHFHDETIPHGSLPG